jgi:hypothetical protein
MIPVYMHEAIMGSSQNQDQSLLGTKNTCLFLKWDLVPFIEIALVKRQLQGAFSFEKMVGGIGLEPMTPSM